MTSDKVLSIDWDPSSARDVALRATERGYPVSGLMYTGSVVTGHCAASVIVEDTGEQMPRGFLRLDNGQGRIALELTPEIIDALLNQLCDAGNIMENTAEARRLRA